MHIFHIVRMFYIHKQEFNLLTFDYLIRSLPDFVQHQPTYVSYSLLTLESVCCPLVQINLVRLSHTACLVLDVTPTEQHE